MPERYERQRGYINIEKFSGNRVMIVGCGAVGSFVAISLAKMGLVNFTLYDGDEIEEHNLPNQFFGEKDLGRNKALATSEYMQNFNRFAQIICNSENWAGQIVDAEIVISGTDKMSVRKELFEKTLKGKSQLFIDCRMGGLQGQVYCIDLEDKEQVENYRKTLFNDGEAVPVRCTERSILFTVLGISSVVCNQLMKAFREEKISNYIVLDYTVPQLM